MADGRDVSTPPGTRHRYQWTEIFRCFQVALDPRKLLVAAAGILAVSLGWYLLSQVFHRKAPVDTNYKDLTILRKDYKGVKHADGKELSDEDLLARGAEDFDRDTKQWNELNYLAGTGGRLSTMPWYEYRGPNPFRLANTLLSGSAPERQDIISDFLSSSIPTLFEPLVKLLIPVVKVFDVDISPVTRIYLLLCIFWSLVCWAFFGGVITRIAAVQLSGKDRVSLGQAVTFVSSRYLSYLLSPVVPLGLIAFAVIVLALLGLPTLLPFVGDLLYVILVPLGLFGGFIMAVLLVGLIGYPLMYTTLSVEGSDTFDALSRAYNYVMQAPWQYLWYCLVAIVYGAAVTLVVVFVASLAVYLGKWSLSQTPFNEAANQRPEYLFTYAPESLGWKQILLHGSPLEKEERTVISTDPKQRKIIALVDKNPEKADRYIKSYAWYNHAAAGMTTFWLVLLFMLMLGFSYSFFWSAMTMIYLLMRRHVDEVELDEVYLEEDEPDSPIGAIPTPTPTPALTPSGTTTVGTGPTSLPMVPPPPATVSFPAPPTGTQTPTDDKK